MMKIIEVIVAVEITTSRRHAGKEPPARAASSDRADRADRRGLGRRRDAAEDRAQHREDQQQRRHEGDRPLSTGRFSSAGTGVAGQDSGSVIALNDHP
jgi:hypothetical protein